MKPAENKDFDLTFKVNIMGRDSVGKSSIYERYTSGIFKQTDPTIGPDYRWKFVTNSNNVRVGLSIWDTGCLYKYAYKKPYLDIF